MILETVKQEIEKQYGISIKEIYSSIQLDEKDDKLISPFENSGLFLVVA